MMRLLALFLTAALAAPAFADPLMVIRSNSTRSKGGNDWARDLEDVENLWLSKAREMGFVPRVFDLGGVTNAEMQTMNKGGVQYGGLLILHFEASDDTTLLNPRSLTLARGRWPTKGPVIIAGFPAAFGAAIWTNSTSCSTGVGGNSGFDANLGKRGTFYKPGPQPIPWKAFSALPPVARTGTPAGIWRPLVAFGYSQAAQNIGGTSLQVRGTNPDSCNFKSDPDSVVSWARLRSSTDTCAVIFAWTTFDLGVIGNALAYADTLTHGRLGRQVPGWEPAEYALALTHACASGSMAAGGVEAFGGADPSQQANITTALDSVRALCILRGAKVTAYIQPRRDSVLANAWQLTELDRFGDRIRFAPELWSGTEATVKGDRSTRHTPNDPFGHSRARTAYDPGKVPPYACADADSSFYCLLDACASFVDSLRPRKRDPSMSSSYSDWTPPSFTRAFQSFTTGGTDGKGLDTLAKIVRSVGVRVLLFNPWDINATPNASSTDLGATTAAADPRGYYMHERDLPVWNDPSARDFQIGAVKLVGFRWFERINPTSIITGHDFAQEFGWGTTTGLWYITELFPYHHHFKTPTRVFVLNMTDLGGDGTWPIRAGYFAWKWYVNRRAAENSYGVTYSRSVFVSELGD